MDMYAKNTVEFVTVAVEYCVYLERAGEKGFENLVGVMQKLLPLLYLTLNAFWERTTPFSMAKPLLPFPKISATFTKTLKISPNVTGKDTRT